MIILIKIILIKNESFNRRFFISSYNSTDIWYNNIYIINLLFVLPFISSSNSKEFYFLDNNSNLSKAKAFSIITIFLFAVVTVLNILYGYWKRRFMILLIKTLIFPFSLAIPTGLHFIIDQSENRFDFLYYSFFFIILLQWINLISDYSMQGKYDDDVKS